MLRFFNAEDLVMLSVKNLKQKKLNKKLSNKLLRLFRIRELVNKQTYRLSLSTTYRIHYVFHVSLLESYSHRSNDDFISKYFLSELTDNKEE